MARVAIVKPDTVEDPAIKEIFDWVTGVESAVPNHFYVEMKLSGTAQGQARYHAGLVAGR